MAGAIPFDPEVNNPIRALGLNRSICDGLPGQKVIGMAEIVVTHHRRKLHPDVIQQLPGYQRADEATQVQMLRRAAEELAEHERALNALKAPGAISRYLEAYGPVDSPQEEVDQMSAGLEHLEERHKGTVAAFLRAIRMTAFPGNALTVDNCAPCAFRVLDVVEALNQLPKLTPKALTRAMSDVFTNDDPRSRGLYMRDLELSPDGVLNGGIDPISTHPQSPGKRVVATLQFSDSKLSHRQLVGLLRELELQVRPANRQLPDLRPDRPEYPYTPPRKFIASDLPSSLFAQMALHLHKTVAPSAPNNQVFLISQSFDESGAARFHIEGMLLKITPREAPPRPKVQAVSRPAASGVAVPAESAVSAGPAGSNEPAGGAGKPTAGTGKSTRKPGGTRRTQTGGGEMSDDSGATGTTGEPQKRAPSEKKGGRRPKQS